MDRDVFRRLLSAEGQAALRETEAMAPREADFLTDFTTLSKTVERELARAALGVAILRGEAAGKFPDADKLYFTREALEQATPWAVSTYRAERFAGYSRALDLGCSIGGDSLALAARLPVTGVELDSLRAAMARANAAALGRNVRVVQGDVRALPFDLGAMRDTVAFFDPARREDGRRAFSVQDYTPPLGIVTDWLGGSQGLGVKVSPGVQLEELAGYDCEIEFISLKGDLKEATLWFGALAGDGVRHRATLLDGAGGMHSMSRGTDSPVIAVGEPRGYLYEPDAAVLRAGMVTHLGAQLGAAQLDAEIAYLTSDDLHATPFARVWAVEDWMPFQLKRLRAYLRERNVGRVTVKKRGSPITPEQLIGDLRLEGDVGVEKTLFLTQQAGRAIVVVAGEEILDL